MMLHQFEAGHNYSLGYSVCCVATHQTMSVWPLSAAQRQDTVQRTANSIAALAFAKKVEISGEDALGVASAIERKAFTAAEVAARTTTGDRPATESVKSYARYAMDSAIGKEVNRWALLRLN